MPAPLSTQLDAVSYRPQRKLLVTLFNQNPRDDIPVDRDELELEDEDLGVLLDFQHFHLPKLESKGFIDYDREDHTVSKGPDHEEIEPLIQLIDEHKDELPDDWL